MKRLEFKIGNQFYDELNGRTITIDGIGNCPKHYSCIVEEVNFEVGELMVTGRQLFTEYELSKFRRLH